jgi:hypothetical protein
MSTPSIDAVIPVLDQPGQFWVFSGSQYVRIAIKNGEPHKDTKDYGPNSIKDWPSLTF